MENNYYIYILKTSKDTLYTGYTNDLERRLKLHQAGKGAKYTRAFQPIKLVASWQIKGSKGQALKIEHSIKKLTRQEKLLLIKKPKLLAKLIGPEGILD